MSTLRARFEEKVDRAPGQGPWGDCLQWTGSDNGAGYGLIRDAPTTKSRTKLLATRVAWFLGFGEWPVSHVLHTCDNPPCVRLEHLFLGTHADNMADMVAKDRWRGYDKNGEKNGRAKLDEVAVRAIRESPESERALAERFGVQKAAIHKIKHRRTWAHV